MIVMKIKNIKQIATLINKNIKILNDIFGLRMLLVIIGTLADVTKMFHFGLFVVTGNGSAATKMIKIGMNLSFVIWLPVSNYFFLWTLG